MSARCLNPTGPHGGPDGLPVTFATCPACGRTLRGAVGLRTHFIAKHLDDTLALMAAQRAANGVRAAGIAALAVADPDPLRMFDPEALRARWPGQG